MDSDSADTSAKGFAGNVSAAPWRRSPGGTSGSTFAVVVRAAGNGRASLTAVEGGAGVRGRGGGAKATGGGAEATGGGGGGATGGGGAGRLAGPFRRAALAARISCLIGRLSEVNARTWMRRPQRPDCPVNGCTSTILPSPSSIGCRSLRQIANATAWPITSGSLEAKKIVVSSRNGPNLVTNSAFDVHRVETLTLFSRDRSPARSVWAVCSVCGSHAARSTSVISATCSPG